MVNEFQTLVYEPLTDDFELKTGDWFEGSIIQYAELCDVHPNDPHLHYYDILQSFKTNGGMVFKGDSYGFASLEINKGRKLTFEQFKFGATKLKEKGLLKKF